jgi:hypothetical protein
MTDKPVTVETTVCVTNSKQTATGLQIRGRVVDVQAKAAERALVGTTVIVEYSGILLPNMVIRTGILFRLSIPLDKVNAALDEVAEGKEASISVAPEIIRPMAEPCARVPLSLLRELRGQESGTEMSRRALVKTWSEDRRTGRQGT